MKDIGDRLVTRHVTQIVVSATKLMVVVCRVMTVIGVRLVTRHVTPIVLSATRRMVVACGVKIKVIGERAVKMNVAITYQIARIVK